MNTKDAAKRIRLLLDVHKLTASAFAEKIGVQRSSISHILSGRNNPSLDLIYKILEQFTDINPMWLIAGEGSMRQLDLFQNEERKERQMISNGETFEHEELPTPPVPPKQMAPPPPENVNYNSPPSSRNERSKSSQNPKGKQTSLPFFVDESDEDKSIEKIVVFYDDKTFAVYKPE